MRGSLSAVCSQTHRKQKRKVNTAILKLWQSKGENERTGSDAEKIADIA